MKITKPILTAIITAMIIPMTSYAATGALSKGTFQYDNDGDKTP